MGKKKRIALGLLAAVLLTTGVAAYTLHHLLTSRVEGAYFDSNGVSIHYTDEGAGYPVVLVHGIGANADINWRRAGVVRMLARDFRVITFDLRGHGLSGKPEDPESYGVELADDIPRLLDHLGIERAHVAGYSLGGFITLKALTRHPERVQSAAFCASGWANVESRDEVPGPYRMPPDYQVEEMRRVAQAGVLPSIESLGVKDWVGGYIESVTISRPVKRALKDSYEELIVTEAELDAIDLPMICFMGTEDGLVPFASALKAQRPDAELVVLEGAGHIGTVLSRDFRRRLHGFLTEHTPGRATLQAQQERQDEHAP